MMDEVKTTGEKIRIFGAIILAISILGLALTLYKTIYTPDVYYTKLFLVPIIISIILYMAPYYYPGDYHVHDFGYFTTKIHDTFYFPTYHSPEIIAGMEMVKISFLGRDKTRIISEQQQYGNMIRKYKIRVRSDDYFEAFYFAFNNEKERNMLEKEIKNKFWENNVKKSSTEFYSSENVLIAFRCYTVSSSKKYCMTAYPYFRVSVASKAAKNVQLKSKREIEEFKIRKKEEKEKALRKKEIEDAAKEVSDKFGAGDFVLDDSKAVKGSDNDADPIDIVKNSTDENARKTAIGKITDEDFLIDTAMNDTTTSVAVAAVRKIDDESVLAQIAKKARSTGARSKAKGRIKDKDLLKEIEEYEKEPYMTCGECGEKYSIVGTHYEAQYDWFFYDLKCDKCGRTSMIPQHMLDE